MKFGGNKGKANELKRYCVSKEVLAARLEGRGWWIFVSYRPAKATQWDLA